MTRSLFAAKVLCLLVFLVAPRALAEDQGSISGLISTPITFSGHADDFVAGPDGNVWLVDQTSNVIGRLAVDGSAYKAFPVPTAAAGVNSITLGPDGNLWFTESSASKVGRITTAGIIGEFPLPPDFHFPQYSFVGTSGTIASGPDGNLWISGIGQMAKVTPQGSVTVVTVPPPTGIQLVQIGKCVAGPDGNLWCLSAAQIQGPYDYRVAKLTAAGVVTLYPETLQEYDIVKAPDGNLWISAGGAPNWNLTRVTPAGVETIYALPTLRESRLAIGADGNIWFTERTTMGNLWQLVLSSATDDGHATFNSAPITTSYPEGIIAVTADGGTAGIHTQRAAAGCPAGAAFYVYTSAEYGENLTLLKTAESSSCATLNEASGIGRGSDVKGQEGGVAECTNYGPDTAEDTQMEIEFPSGAQISSVDNQPFPGNGWAAGCKVFDSGGISPLIRCGPEPVDPNSSRGMKFFGQFHINPSARVFGTVTCTSSTPYLPNECCSPSGKLSLNSSLGTIKHTVPISKRGS